MKRFPVRATLARGACLAVALTGACSKPAGDEAAAEHVQPVVAASVETIAAQRFIETVDAIGVVTPRPGHVASLAAPRSHARDGRARCNGCAGQGW